jgi:hypothetical protein
MGSVTVNWTGGASGSVYVNFDEVQSYVGGAASSHTFTNIPDGSHNAKIQFGNTQKSVAFEIPDDDGQQIYFDV